MMPIMNGYDATRRINDQRETAHIPVVALTASALPQERNQAMEAGCDGYISKPIDTRAFPGQVRQFLSRTDE
jgi:CheY-like chemotaxis protein